MTRSTILLFPALLSLTTTAQSVFIPDEDLQVYLYGKCAACMDTVSGMMDVGLWNAAPSSLNIPPSISPDGHLDLTGIDQMIVPFLSFEWYGGGSLTLTFPAYPQGLASMDVDHVDFAQFPDVSTLSPAFGSLGCFSCQLTDLPAFQPPFHRFNISDCDLSSGSNVVPSSVTELYLFDCNLSTCPALPAGLSQLSLAHNNLTSLPPLPNSLFSLYAIDNVMASLPSLPSSLSSLGVNDNPLETLPTLPDGLQELGIMNTLLTTPFDALPPGLTSLNADGMIVDLLPPVLPGGLQILQVNNSPITSLPELPPTLQWLDASGTLQLNCLPVLPDGLTQLQMTGSAVECLPNIPTALVPNLEYIGMPAVVCDPAVTQCELFDPLFTGTVFSDLDSDGVQDVDDLPRPNAIVRTTPGNILTASGADGRYVLPISTGPYNVDGVPIPYNTITTVPHAVNLTGPAEIDSLNDIGYHAAPGVYDLVVSAMTSTAMVTGFGGDVWFTVKNIGTEPVSAEITFTLDPSLTWQAAEPAVTALNGNTGTWSIPEIGVGEMLSFAVAAYTDPGIAMGTPLACQATAMLAQADVTPLDNFRLLDGIVVSSYDPNDKRVEPTTLTPTEVAAGTRVTYTIRFQNTGTFPAQRVVLKDTLRIGLQRPTFEFLGSSHPCTWYMLRSTLYFIFDDIQLPDSATDEAGSHGYVQFSVVPRTDLALGAQVTNEAYIYFDYNEPILTEQAVLTVDASTAVDPLGRVTSRGVEMWPNPVVDVLHVQCAGGKSIEVLDVTGRVVLRERSAGAFHPLDVRSLASGGYTLRIPGVGARVFIKR